MRSAPFVPSDSRSASDNRIHRRAAVHNHAPKQKTPTPLRPSKPAGRDRPAKPVGLAKPEPTARENETEDLKSHPVFTHGLLQRKLTIGASNDPLEQEADRVAEHVMREPQPKSEHQAPQPAAVPTPRTAVQTESADIGESGGSAAPAIVGEALRSSGQALDASTRAFMEPRFGRDFRDVRVHTDARAAGAAAAISARAFTAGRDIVFGENRFAPHTQSGRELLAHELAHVSQQARGTIRRQMDGDDDKKGAAKDSTKAAAQAHEEAGGTPADSTKTLSLSRGVLQMTSEGDFTEGDNSVKRPLFPFNINIFQKLTDAEIKSYDDAKTKHDQDKKKNPKLGAFVPAVARYGEPNANGVFKKDAAGGYKMGARVNRHDFASYTATLADGQQLGTTNSSGVTISFGVDLGNRYSSKEAAKKEFIKAGLLDASGNAVGGNGADRLLEAIGLKGLPAARKAAELRAAGVEITSTQALKLLGTATPDYDKRMGVKGYEHGDGTLDPALEEVLTASSYWGLSTGQRKDVYDAAKGKSGAEQYTAAAKAIGKQIDALPASKAWMKRGYSIFKSYLEVLAEKIAAGYKIELSEDVASAETLTGPDDSTLKIVQEVSKRAAGGKGGGKDLKKQLTGIALPQDAQAAPKTTAAAKSLADGVAESVGSGGANRSDDVRKVQIRLHDLGLLSDADFAAETPGAAFGGQSRALDGPTYDIAIVGDGQSRIAENSIPKTIEAIRAFQKLASGRDQVDGNIGARGPTWSALRNANLATIAKMAATSKTPVGAGSGKATKPPANGHADGAKNNRSESLRKPLADAILQRYAVFIPFTSIYVNLDEAGLGLALGALSKANPGAVLDVFDALDAQDATQVAHEMIDGKTVKQLQGLGRGVLLRLKTILNGDAAKAGNAEDSKSSSDKGERRAQAAEELVKSLRAAGTIYQQETKGRDWENRSIADCTKFLQWVLEDTGESELFGRKTATTMGMQHVIAKLQTDGKPAFRFSNPKVGDIMMWGGHVGVVYQVETVKGLKYVVFAHMGTHGAQLEGRKHTKSGDVLWLKADDTATIDGIGKGDWLGYWTPP
jgi:hypothetical protein